MKLNGVFDQGVSVSLSADELLILNNALNEVCNGIEVPEFSPRIGAGVDEVRKLLKEMAQALDRIAK